MPLAVKILTSDAPKAKIKRTAACLQKALDRDKQARGARVTVSEDGNIKVYAPTRRSIASTQDAVTRNERRCIIHCGL